MLNKANGKLFMSISEQFGAFENYTPINSSRVLGLYEEDRGKF